MLLQVTTNQQQLLTENITTSINYHLLRYDAIEEFNKDLKAECRKGRPKR